VSTTRDHPDAVERTRRWLARPGVRLALCWLLCLGVAAQRWHHARHEFDSGKHPEPEKHRADTNNGHTHIDFGGQWVFGRLAATGRWRDLYHRDAQWEVVREAFPLDRQSPAKRRHAFPADDRPPHLSPADVQTDADYLMESILGDDRDRARANGLAPAVGAAVAGSLDGNPIGVAASLAAANERVTPEVAESFRHPVLGGPLYPPVHALLYAPLGAIADPQRAYFTFQWVLLGACLLAGWFGRVISAGRVWWPVATTVLLLLPGGRAGLDLAQNPYLTLAILTGGWALVVRGREFAGGGVWGLLAFKPVWGLAFILVPVLMRRWRMVAGTGAVGVGLVLATLPFVGVTGWQQWLEVGRRASAKYEVDGNWTNLSRDVYGLTRRFTLDFSKPEDERNNPTARAWSVGCLAAVFAGTVGVYLWRGDRRKTTGLSAGFLLLGAFLCCYRFMYYDVMLAGVGFAALLAYPAWTLRTPTADVTPPAPDPWRRRLRLHGVSVPLTALALLLVNDNLLVGIKPQATIGVGYYELVTKDRDGKEGTRPPVVSMASDWNHPVDTLIVVAAWGWCGFRLIRDGRRADDESVAWPGDPRP
jgi:hypothetical protein